MDQISQELQRNAEPAPDQLPWNLDFNKSSGVHLPSLYLRALPRVDEAVDHAEVVERRAEGTALPRTSAGRERAIVGRSLAAAIAGAGAQLQVV